MSLHEWKLSARGERRQPSFISTKLVKALHIPGMVSLGAGVPHPELNNLHGMKLVTESASEISIPHSSIFKSTTYVPTLGFGPLREWIRYYMTREHQYPHADATWDFIIGNGSQDLLQRMFDIILDPEDTLLVEEYTYSGALSAAGPVGCDFVPCPMDEHGLDPDALESLLKNWNSTSTKKLPKALYIVPVAQNPTGTSISNERKKKIYQIACTFGLIIIEDDAYWHLNFTELEPEEKRTTFWSLDTEQRVIRLESFSKVTAIGYRVGWACGPKMIIEKISYDLEAGAQSGSGIAQLVIHEMLSPLLNPSTRQGWDAHLSRIRKTYYDRWNIVEAALRTHLTGITEWQAPRGGMFAWVNLLGVEDSEVFVQQLAEQYLVLVVPGAAFSCDPTKKSSFVRISFSFCDTAALEPSIAKLGIALKKYTSQ